MRLANFSKNMWFLYIFTSLVCEKHASKIIKKAQPLIQQSSRQNHLIWKMAISPSTMSKVTSKNKKKMNLFGPPPGTSHGGPKPIVELPGPALDYLGPPGLPYGKMRMQNTIGFGILYDQNAHAFYHMPLGELRPPRPRPPPYTHGKKHTRATTCSWGGLRPPQTTPMYTR